MGADYIYATAYVRSQEKKLLTEEQFRMMTESGNIDDICKTLQDAGYGSESNALTPANYQEVLKQTETELFNEIRELSKNEKTLNIFSYPADYHNIKVLLKAEALGIERDDILMTTGTVSPEDMRRSVNERSAMLLTENMAKAIDEAADVHARTKDPQMIDFICDRYCFADILETAEESKSDFVRGYVKLWIDTVNLKVFARVKKMGQPWTYFDEIFIPGGNADKQVFIGAYEGDMKHAAEKFAPFDIGPAVSGSAEEVDRQNTFTLLEKLCDDILMEYVRRAKFVTFGLEPLVAFLLSRQNEIKCVRILMAGKTAGMDPEIIRERLRVTYE